MCQAKYFQEFRQAVSDNRLQPYLDNTPNGDEDQAFAAYLWNMALCESLYPSFHGIEVALRNSIHQAAHAEFGDEFWFRNRLVGHEKEKIDGLEKEFRRAGRPISSGQYISECTFGFWVSLFIGKYEQRLWRRLLQPVFPHSPRRLRQRSGIHARLDRIRRLRNRVFHHEPIWHLPDLEQRHDEILETIGWLSPAMLAATRLLDRFDSVYTRGARHYAAELDSIAQNWSA